VAWDAVNLPQPVHRKLVLEPEAAGRLSPAIRSGEPLPQEPCSTRLLAARNFPVTAWAMLVRFELITFDFPVASARNRLTRPCNRFLIRWRAAVFGFFRAAFNRFQNGFGHIFFAGVTLRVLPATMGRSSCQPMRFLTLRGRGAYQYDTARHSAQFLAPRG